jgi:A/G-specific adenine glycosylase
VAGYFDRFLTRWPKVEDLAAASLDEVLHQWQGLGYYARARNLHQCAKRVTEDFAGRFPQTEAGLRELPGIGAYTAAAIAAIAFDQRAAVMDGNVERVMARLFGIETALPDAKPALYAKADELTPSARPGDYAQAVMDLGATICTPRQPRCMLCPWRRHCSAYESGNPESLPRRREKPQRPNRYGVAFWLVRDDGAVLLRRRAEKGLLGGLIEVPSTEWQGTPSTDLDAVARSSPVPALQWQILPGSVGHTFTHFHLELSVLAGSVSGRPDGLWVKPSQFGDHALPTVMKKVTKFAIAGLAQIR